jgi:hypothetical protein
MPSAAGRLLLLIAGDKVYEDVGAIEEFRSKQ